MYDMTTERNVRVQFFQNLEFERGPSASSVVNFDFVHSTSRATSSLLYRIPPSSPYIKRQIDLPIRLTGILEQANHVDLTKGTCATSDRPNRRLSQPPLATQLRIPTVILVCGIRLETQAQGSTRECSASPQAMAHASIYYPQTHDLAARLPVFDTKKVPRTWEQSSCSPSSRRSGWSGHTRRRRRCGGISVRQMEGLYWPIERYAAGRDRLSGQSRDQAVFGEYQGARTSGRS